MRPVRLAVVFAALVLAMAVAAPPVGAFDEQVNSGTTGFYTIPDSVGSPGAKCRYENRPGKVNDETNWVSSRQIWTHGPFASKSWIGHRVLVQVRKNVSSPWKTAWKSRVVKKRANDSAVAFFDPQRYWTPEGHRKMHRVVHILTFYKMGSATQVVGKVRGAVEVYAHSIKGEAPYEFGTEGGPAGWCKKRFWA